jgi:hypothetical protein
MPTAQTPASPSLRSVGRGTDSAAACRYGNHRGIAPLPSRSSVGDGPRQNFSMKYGRRTGVGVAGCGVVHDWVPYGCDIPALKLLLKCPIGPDTGVMTPLRSCISHIGLVINRLKANKTRSGNFLGAVLRQPKGRKWKSLGYSECAEMQDHPLRHMAARPKSGVRTQRSLVWKTNPVSGRAVAGAAMRPVRREPGMHLASSHGGCNDWRKVEEPRIGKMRTKVDPRRIHRQAIAVNAEPLLAAP